MIPSACWTIHRSRFPSEGASDTSTTAASRLAISAPAGSAAAGAPVSDHQCDLAPGRSAAQPNIRRLRKAVDQYPGLWAFAQDPSVVDLSPTCSAATLPIGAAREPGGPAGTVVRLHCRVVHDSAVNAASRMRPLLLNVRVGWPVRAWRRMDRKVEAAGGVSPIVDT